MYVTPRQRTRYFWTTILLILMLPLTAFAAVMAIRYFSGASGETTPKNVILSNITSNAVSITWTTDSETAGSVTVNSGKGDSTPFVDIRGTDRRKTHHIDIVDLDPSKDYSFSILSNDTKYGDEKGKNFKFRTSPVTSETPVPKPIYGSVEGTDKNDVVVYITLEGDDKTYPASSATTATGKWIVDLSALRDPATKDLVKVDSNTKINILAKGADTLGGSVSGTYGELIDSEGQLNTQIQLSDIPTDSLLAEIPSKSQIASVSSTVTTPKPTEPDPDPVDPEPNEPEVPVGDVIWTALPGTTSSQSSSSETGGSTVKVTNLTDTGFNVIWLSSSPVVGTVKYGTDQSNLTDTGYDERDSAVSQGNFTTHSVRINRLTAQTKYYFAVYEGTTLLKSDSLTTYATLSTPPDFKSVTGNVENLSGGEALLTMQITRTGASSTLGSTLVDNNGGWVATLGDFRTADGSAYYDVKDTDSVKIAPLSLTNIKSVSTTVKKAVESSVALTASSGGSRKIVKVKALSNYGVYAGSIIVKSQTSNTNEENGIGGGGGNVIPNTGIYDTLIYTIVVGAISIFIAIFTYIQRNRRYSEKESKNNMISSVN
jgi:hypothetical protein